MCINQPNAQAYRQRKYFFCGGDPHPREKCPARNSICFACQKQGHHASVCRSKQNYPQLFTGLGTMGPGSEYTIKLKPNPKPYSLSTPRNIPLPLRDKVKEQIRIDPDELPPSPPHIIPWGSQLWKSLPTSSFFPALRRAGKNDEVGSDFQS